MAQQIQIVNGPSKWDLMLTLFDSVSAKRLVTFTLERGFSEGDSSAVGILKAQINSLEREDGSGECWIFAGHSEEPHSHGRNISGFYSTRNRKGFVEFED